MSLIAYLGFSCVPSLLKLLLWSDEPTERLQSNLLRGLTTILQQAQALQTNHLSNLQSRVAAAQQALAAIDIVKDQELFVTYNLRPFTVPGDWGFEPCTGYYDTVRCKSCANCYEIAQLNLGRDVGRTSSQDRPSE